MSSKKISVIGAGIIDILAGPVDDTIISAGSTPVKTIKMTCGGDALNEAVIMSRLGLETELITRIGNDEAGRKILEFVGQNGVKCLHAADDSIETGINIVLVDMDGQRSFLTNPASSLRKLSEEDIVGYIDGMGEIVCFASMFVSPALDIASMERIFAKIKSAPGRKLVVDMTTAKNGETLEDIRGLMRYIDYLIPNETEACRLTGIDDPHENARLFAEAGASCVVIKCGKQGCIIKTDNELFEVAAYDGAKAVDTTGAGDSFVAGFVYGLENGMSLRECGAFACAVASCVVEKYGAHDGIWSVHEPMARFKKMTK